MAKELKPISYFDFSGGLRLDVAPILLPNDAVQKAVNVNFDDKGRITKRLGYKAFGSPRSYSPGIVAWNYKWSAGTSGNFCMEEGDGTNAAFLQLKVTKLNGAITTASTTITVSSGTVLTDPAGAATHYIEIDGDIVGYTDLSTNTLTGVTGITEAHATDTVVRQWAVPANGIIGNIHNASSAQLNDLVFVSADGEIWDWDNTTFADISKAYNLVTEYKNKLYAVDLASGTMNNIHFSNADDGTTWTATDTFYLTKGGKFPVICLKKIGNYLGIFKETEFHTWDDYTVKLRSSQLGTFNHKTAKEVNKLVYFSNPSGVYATDGESISQDLGEPIKAYLDDLTPTYEAGEQFISNVAAGRYENKYVLHIGNTTTRDTLTDVNVVYDTINKNWTTWTGLDADTCCFDFLERYKTASASGVINSTSGLYVFGGSTNHQVYQFGGTTYHDNYSEISAEVIFKPYTLGVPHRKKHIGTLVVYSEVPGYSLYYNLDGEQNWRPLGQVTKNIQKFTIDKEATTITLKLTESSKNKPFVFNGVIFDKCYVTEF